MQRLGVGGNDLDPEAICLAKELGALPLALALDKPLRTYST